MTIFEILEPVFPVCVVFITLIALSGLVLIVSSIFWRFARHYYNKGWKDGARAQAIHEQMCKEEEKAENE